jgi:hypothetical protein
MYAQAAAIDARPMMAMGQPPRITSGSPASSVSAIAATIACLTARAAALGIADVVLQIGDDLHQHGGAERSQRQQPVEGARERPGQAGGHDDGHGRDP